MVIDLLTRAAGRAFVAAMLSSWADRYVVVRSPATFNPLVRGLFLTSHLAETQDTVSIVTRDRGAKGKGVVGSESPASRASQNSTRSRRISLRHYLDTNPQQFGP